MHACGHDAHTAMLLGTAKALYLMRDKIGCRVKLLFQPSEEGIRSGAEALVNGGLMEEIDVIVGLHVENWLPSGSIGVCRGSSMASSRSFRIDFHGATAHATLPHTGVDALAAAIRTYNNIQYMTARETNPFSKYVCSIGKLAGGTTQNVIADYAYMLGTIRAFDMSVDSMLIDGIRRIAGASAEKFGCTAKVDTNLKAYVIYNDPDISALVLDAARKVVGDEHVVDMPVKMSSEDFSYYLTKRPGVFFRLGTRNAEKGCTTLPHNSDFMIDEDALVLGSDTCVQFVLDNMNGVDMDKIMASDERR
jgi:amidohydrolase